MAALLFTVAVTAVAVCKGSLELAALHSASAAERPNSLVSAGALSPLNWRYPLGNGEMMALIGRHEEALQFYQEGLRLFEGCARCWIGIAESRAAQGDSPRSAIDRAVHLGRSVTSIRTRAAVLFTRLGDEQSAADEFAAAIGGQRFEKDDHFLLLNRVYDSDFVISNIVSHEALIPYLDFAMRRLEPEPTANVWERCLHEGVADTRRVAYARYLAKHGRVRDAWDVALSGRAPGFLNGDFEDATADYGYFGWQVSDDDGVRARITHCSRCSGGRRALRIRFDGDHNPNYRGTSQAIPVAGGRSYFIDADVKYDDITSAQGPQLLVTGVSDRRTGARDGCRLRAAGEELKSSSDWRGTRVVFDVPMNCVAIRVVVARSRTTKLDRYVGGELWLDNFRLKLAPSTAEQAREDASTRLLAG